MVHTLRERRTGGIRNITDDGANAIREAFSHLVPQRRSHMQRTDYLLDELEEMFDRTDEDGDRRIGFDEFKGLMLEMDDPRTESALLVSFRAIDTNHDGSISFDELRAWWIQSHPTPA